MTIRTGSLAPMRAGGVEQAHLAGGVEAVARLDLDRGDAAAHQRVEAAAGAVEQLVGAGGLGRGDGRGDAAAGLGDLLIGRAGAAHGMLVGAGAAEHEMGVAVDQPRRDPGAAAAATTSLARKPASSVRLPTRTIRPSCDADRGIGDHAERIARLRRPSSRHGSR